MNTESKKNQETRQRHDAKYLKKINLKVGIYYFYITILKVRYLVNGFEVFSTEIYVK